MKIYIILFVLLMLWQILMLKKYYFGYSSIKIDNNNNKVIVDKIHINFSDINAIRVVTCENQPSTFERALSKSAFYAYLTNIEFYLKNDTIIPVKCNSNRTVNNIISNLIPFVDTISDERDKKNNNSVKAAALGFIIAIAIVIFIFLTVTMPH